MSRSRDPRAIERLADEELMVLVDENEPHAFEVFYDRHLLRQDGTASAAVPHLAGASAVLVTREPRGGSSQPTSAPLLRAPL